MICHVSPRFRGWWSHYHRPRPESPPASRITARVPISIRRRGGRKLVLAPDRSNVTMAPVRRHIDNAMVKAIARAFRWRELLENGTHATIGEIAASEKSMSPKWVGCCG
jgi:hypothetical protein